MDVASSSSSSTPRLRPSRSRGPAGPLSFETVFRSHYDFVWRTLLRLGVAEGAVDDAAQDVFVVVHHRLEQFEGRAKVRTWLFEIARRVAMRYRARARRVPVPDAPVAEQAICEESEPDEHLSRTQALRLLQGWLDELDDDKRVVFVLSELEQMRGPEIADVLGVNVNTVYTRLRMARQHIVRRSRRLATLERCGDLRRLHREAGPGPAERRRAWALLGVKVGFVGKAGATAGAGGLLSSLAVGIKAAAIGMMVTGGAVLAVDAASDGTGAAQAKPAVTASVVRPVTAARGETPLSPAVAEPRAAVEAPATVAGPDPLAVHLSQLEARALGTAPSRRGRGAAPRSPADPPSPSPTPAALAVELERFERAQRSARRGDDEIALREVEGYLDRYPAGQFVPEARVMRVRSLCRLGRVEQARALAVADGVSAERCADAAP